MDPRREIPTRLLAIGGVAIVAAIAAFILIPRGGASGNPPTTTASGATTSTQAGEPTAAKHSQSTKAKGAKIVGTAAIERALRTSPVVVVAAYQPSAVIDMATAAEAKAGAKTAGVAWVGLDVSDEQQARNLTTLLQGAPASADTSLTGGSSLPSTPAVLVFRRPRTLFLNFHGYVDRQIVAQAAALAAGRAAGSAWQRQANLICRHSTEALGQLAVQYAGSTDAAASLTRIEKTIGVAKQVLTQLHAVHPPAARAAEFEQALAVEEHMLAEAENMVAALRKSDSDAFLKAAMNVTSLSSTASQAFIGLGLPDCV